MRTRGESTFDRGEEKDFFVSLVVVYRRNDAAAAKRKARETLDKEYIAEDDTLGNLPALCVPHDWIDHSDHDVCLRPS
eukprot:scaffold2069_cov187-Amphora_coffeaeformis.AAC.8